MFKYLLALLYRKREVWTEDNYSCFGSNPGSQDRAENDCISCVVQDDCLKESGSFCKQEQEY